MSRVPETTITIRKEAGKAFSEIVNLALHLDDFDERDAELGKGCTYLRAEMQHERDPQVTIRIEYKEEGEEGVGTVTIRNYRPQDTTKIGRVGPVTYERLTTDLERVIKQITEGVLDTFIWQARPDKKNFQ